MSLSLQIPCHITHSELIEGIAKGSGNPYKMVRIQGVLELGADRQIFRTILPSGSELPAVGQYIAEFAPRVNNASMELGGSITKISKSSPKAGSAS